MTKEKEDLIKQLENYEPYALCMSAVNVNSDIILNTLAFLRRNRLTEDKASEENTSNTHDDHNANDISWVQRNDS